MQSILQSRVFAALLCANLVHMAPKNAGKSPNNGNPAATHYGRQVRKARREHGWSIHELARRTGLNAGTLSHIENGHYAPTERTATIFDRVFPERKKWFSEFYRDSQEWTPPGYRSWYEQEKDATHLRVWSPGVLHGLVQTEDYARALFKTFPGVTDEIIDARVRSRMERQKRILNRDNPPFVWVLIDEPSLYRLVGSPEIMAAQMDHLLAVAALPNVTVQVLPAVAHPVNASELIVTDNAAYAEHVWSGYTFTETETVTSLATLITTIQAECYRASESMQMIERVRDKWARGENPLTATRTGGPA